MCVDTTVVYSGSVVVVILLSWVCDCSLRLQSPMSMSCGSPSLSDMPLGSSGGRRPTSHRYISTKVLLAEGGDTPFTEHCRNYENSYRVRTQVPDARSLLLLVLLPPLVLLLLYFYAACGFIDGGCVCILR